MPIVISRKTGEVLHMPKYTPEQIFQLQVAYIKAWANENMDVLASNETIEEYLQKCENAHNKQKEC